MQIKLHPNSGISLKVTAQGSARLGCYQSIKCVTTGNCGGNESCAGSSREARKQLTISVFDCGLEGPRWYTGSGGMTNGSNTDEGTETENVRRRRRTTLEGSRRKSNLQEWTGSQAEWVIKSRRHKSPRNTLGLTQHGDRFDSRSPPWIIHGQFLKLQQQVQTAAATAGV